MMCGVPKPKDDDDQIDGCALDFAEAPDDELTASLRSLFPDGKKDPKKEALYKELAKLDA